MLTFHVVLEKRKVEKPVMGTEKTVIVREVNLVGRRSFINEYGHKQLHNDKYRQGTVVVETDGNGKILDYGASFCSPQDQFTRRDGRVRAIGKMHSKNQEKRIPEVNGVTREELYEAIHRYVIEDGQFH